MGDRHPVDGRCRSGRHPDNRCGAGNRSGHPDQHKANADVGESAGTTGLEQRQCGHGDRPAGRSQKQGVGTRRVWGRHQTGDSAKQSGPPTPIGSQRQRRTEHDRRPQESRVVVPGDGDRVPRGGRLDHRLIGSGRHEDGCHRQHPYRQATMVRALSGRQRKRLVRPTIGVHHRDQHSG